MQKPPASIRDDGEKSKENHPIEERGNRTNGERKEGRPDSWVLGPAPVRRDDKDEEGQDDGLEVDELPEERTHRDDGKREAGENSRRARVVLPYQPQDESGTQEMEESREDACRQRITRSPQCKPGCE